MSAEDWTPAFPGQRPPFQPGHELSTKHGAYSPAKVDPLAKALVESVLTDERTTYLRESRFAVALWRWGQAEARYELLSAYVDGMTLQQAASSKDGSTPLLDQLRRWDEQAARHRGRLGLDPVSAARLEHDLVDSAATAKHAGLDQVRAAGAALVAANPAQPSEGTTADEW